VIEEWDKKISKMRAAEDFEWRTVELRRAGSKLFGRAQAAAAIAERYANEVDAAARFPSEAIAAARNERLLGTLVPTALGGDGCGFGDVVDVCYVLGRSCASTGLIYAMHQTKVACILRHHRAAPWHRQLLRLLSDEQLLLASSTTEGQNGGNIRSSSAAVEHADARITLERDATVISYGEHADGIVTLARRAAGAANTDQVLCVFRKSDYSLERVLEWDTLGMRGTCSAGFRFKAEGEAAQILADPYEKIHAQTMMPVAHLMWSGTWAGIAAGAVERARLYVRNATRGADGKLPPGAAHLTQAIAKLRVLRSVVAAGVRRFEAISSDPAALETVEFQTYMNLLKVNASEQALSTVMSAMQATGLSGYRNDSQFSIGRYLRDILSAPIMINNERILNGVALTSLVAATPALLRDPDEAADAMTDDEACLQPARKSIA
jgi:acyl-CoA dehydrogenase